MKKNCWQERWEKGERANSKGGGGQGFTHLARPLGDPGQFNAVLKGLKFQKDEVRRGRMAAEVIALMRLHACSGVSQLLDSNAATDFQEDVELYLVTERIFGPDLYQFYTPGRDVKEIATVIIRTLETLGQCHELGIIHRDIKPEHVILRDGAIEEPALIDFGLSFNESDDSDTMTETGETVGNRFIILPENSGGQLDKRDRRTDVTQIAGLLFYLVTGERPGNIAGPNGPPHARVDLAAKSPHLSAQEIGILRSIFSVAFRLDMNERWETATRLSEEVLRLQNGTADELETDWPEYQSRMKELADSILRTRSAGPAVRRRELAHHLLSSINSTLLACSNTFSQQLTLQQTATATGEAANPNVTKCVLVLARTVPTHMQRTATFHMDLAGTDLVLTFQTPGLNVRQCRVAPSDDMAKQKIGGFVQNRVHEWIDHVMQDDQRG